MIVNGPVFKRLRRSSCVPLLAISWVHCQSARAQGDNQMPTPEQLRSFVTQFDGETRPDLVRFYLKLEHVISGYHSLERLKEVFTQRDSELTEAFRAIFRSRGKPSQKWSMKCGESCASGSRTLMPSQ
jgi:hypothetical protein